jgi:ATP-binding cassette subfamily C protein LapB
MSSVRALSPDRSPANEPVRPDRPQAEKPAQPAPQHNDPLLGCLLTVAELFERPVSAEALTAGLPAADSGLDPELLVRAAERVDLSAAVVVRKLDEIDDLLLPAILLLKDRRACVLVRRLPGGLVEIVPSETVRGRTQITEAELAARYVGTAIYVKPNVEAAAREYESEDAPATRHWFWDTLARFWPTYTQVGFASVLVNLFALVTPIFTMSVYDRVVPNAAWDSAWDTLRALAFGVLLIFLFDAAIRTARGYFIDATGRAVDILLASRIFQQVLGVKIAARPQSTGSFASEVREFESLRDFMTSVTLTAIVDLPFVALFLITIFWIGGWLMLVPLFAIPAVIAVGLLIQIPLDRVIRKNMRESALKHAILVEAISGLETIKAARGESRVQRRYENYVGASAETAHTSRFLSGIAVNFSLLMQNIVTVGVIFGGVYLISQGDLTMGGLIACSMLASRAIAPLGQVAALLARWQQSKQAYQTLTRIMNLAVERPAGHRFLSRPRLKGDIEFRKVTFSYPGMTVPALDQLAFTIKAGERVGILGRIGSGKTTIEKLIGGFYEPQEGTILVDGTDIRQIDPVDLRRNIGCVLQEVQLFAGTARENIVLSQPHADDQDVLRAARMSGADDWISRHPQGYDLPVGERGQFLSGGQRQTVAIARAVLPDPPILLFDEPTANMDHASETRFRQRLEEIVQGKTVLLITHRSALLALVDRIIVVDSGRVVADGPREQIIQALSQGQVRSAT